ncbi:hypothetical protein AB0D90_00805 [Streptomyces althioticus]|uniref:Membrane protein n=1 Tax=Streptomyces griseorubens TaxID=66897 RepID=A0ABR4T5X1_9ACTN|nr:MULTISPECIES: hypothetical protein [Actinomycetes]KEG42391.1 membrane protein [Streptomyces griseorubens]
MSTTRHHINRQRLRQARAARPEVVEIRPRPGTRGAAGPRGPRAAEEKASGPARSRPRRPWGLAALCALTVLLGAFAGWAHAEAESLRAEPALSNTALTDVARTSEVKGQVAEAVDRLFSYDHADPAAFDKAAKDLLTGKAVDQHRDLFADVRERADARKAVITTAVTETAVERIDGDRARVLVYADQSSVATAGGKAAAQQDDGVYAAAMLAVDTVHRDGRWLITSLDTFDRT